MTDRYGNGITDYLLVAALTLLICWMFAAVWLGQ